MIVDWTSLLASDDVRRLIDAAIDEDVGSGDVTTEAIFAEPRAAVHEGGAARIDAPTPGVGAPRPAVTP